MVDCRPPPRTGCLPENGGEARRVPGGSRGNTRQITGSSGAQWVASFFQLIFGKGSAEKTQPTKQMPFFSLWALGI